MKEIIKNFFSIKGRLNRLEYFGALLSIFLIFLTISLLITCIPKSVSINTHVMSFFEVWLSTIFTAPSISFSSIGGKIVVLFTIILFILINNAMVKRLHDINLSGLWIITYWIIYSLRLGL